MPHCEKYCWFVKLKMMAPMVDLRSAPRGDLADCELGGAPDAPHFGRDEQMMRACFGMSHRACKQQEKIAASKYCSFNVK